MKKKTIVFYITKFHNLAFTVIEISKHIYEQLLNSGKIIYPIFNKQVPLLVKDYPDNPEDLIPRHDLIIEKQIYKKDHKTYTFFIAYQSNYPHMKNIILNFFTKAVEDEKIIFAKDLNNMQAIAIDTAIIKRTKDFEIEEE